MHHPHTHNPYLEAMPEKINCGLSSAFHNHTVGFYLDSVSGIKEPPCRASVQSEILPCDVPKWDRKNICKKYILVSTLPTAKAKSQIFHDVISQRSWFSGQNLTSSVLKKLQWSCTGESGLLCVTCYNLL